jgi:hypothetical protein
MAEHAEISRPLAGQPVESSPSAISNRETSSNQTTPHWLIEAQRLDREGQTDAAMDLVFDRIDEMLTANQFRDVNSILDAVTTGDWSLTMLMGFLSITLSAADRLPSRPAFFDRVWKTCTSMGKNPEKLLGGLRERRDLNGTSLRDRW